MFTEYLFAGTMGTKLLWHLRTAQWKALPELKDMQLKRLKAIVKYAYEYVPSYHQLFKTLKFKPEDLRSLEDLRKIPITKKMDIQGNPEEYLANGVDKSRCVDFFTSGSTGIPLKTYKDIGAAVTDTVLKAYGFLECGVRLTDKFANIARDRRSMMLPSQILVPPSTPRTDIVVDYLRRIKPDVLYTGATMLQDLCFTDPFGIDPRLIFTQAVTVTEYCRSLTKHTFGVEINDTYGSTELGRLAFECNEHSGLHMITEGAVIEFVDDNGEPVAPGEIGKVVATGLHNHAMPMIRYDLGDIGVPSDERCSCGRNWPLIDRIEGRANDIFIMPSGRKIYPIFLFSCIGKEIKENLFCISQYQIIQKKRNRIIIEVAKGRDFDPNVISRIRQNLETGFTRIGEDVHIDVRFVKEIPVDGTRKRKTLISLLNQDH